MPNHWINPPIFVSRSGSSIESTRRGTPPLLLASLHSIFYIWYSTSTHFHKHFIFSSRICNIYFCMWKWKSCAGEKWEVRSAKQLVAFCTRISYESSPSQSELSIELLWEMYLLVQHLLLDFFSLSLRLLVPFLWKQVNHLKMHLFLLFVVILILHLTLIPELEGLYPLNGEFIFTFI